LHLAFKKNFVTCEDLLANLWGRKGQEPGTKESAIGKGQYASAHASLSRSLTRLWMKNLIIYWKTLTRYRTGITLTDAGEALARTIMEEMENEEVDG
jgi:hypothetical protein